MAKILLKSMDDGQQLEAQFNPTEIQLAKKVPWQPQKTVHGDIPDLEYTEASAETLSFELMFDGYTDGVDVYQAYVSKLLAMMQPIPTTRTPPKIELVWQGFPRFRGVIESASVKYIMFFSNGAPARATASVTMTQAYNVRPGSSSSPGAKAGVTLVEGEGADKAAMKAGYVGRDGAPDNRGFLNNNPPADGTTNLRGGTQVNKA